MKNAAKLFSSVLYAAGALLALALLLIAVLRVPYVPFPDAMLPATLGELAIDWLALGALPMIIATAWLESAHPALETAPRRKWLLRLPAMLCAGAVLLIVSVWTAGLFNMAFTMSR